jgi:GTP-binding protein HflX
VGFISDLPTELVASFRATLEEVLAADLIVHVRDISHEGSEEQAADVRTILTSLGVGEGAKQIEVWNKIDLLEPDDQDAVMTRAARHDDVIAVSSITGAGIQDFILAVEEALEGEIIEETLILPYAEGRKRAWLFERSLVEAERQGEDGFELDLRWKAKERAQFQSL